MCRKFFGNKFLPDVDGDVANKNCIVTCHYYNNPDYYSDELDCMQVLNMLDKLDMLVAWNDNRMQLMDTLVVLA